MKVLDTTFLVDLVNGKKETKKISTSPNLLTTQINMYEIMIKADHPTNRFFYFGIENHYNGLGYKLVADSIVDAIY